MFWFVCVLVVQLIKVGKILLNKIKKFSWRFKQITFHSVRSGLDLSKLFVGFGSIFQGVF